MMGWSRVLTMRYFIPASTQGDPIFGREQVALMDRIDTLLLGRVTYGMFAGFWPNVTEGAEKEFADKFNAVPKIVFSKSLKHAPWGKWNEGKLVRGSVVEEVPRVWSTSIDLCCVRSCSLAADRSFATTPVRSR